MTSVGGDVTVQPLDSFGSTTKRVNVGAFPLQNKQKGECMASVARVVLLSMRIPWCGEFNKNNK